MVSVAQKTIPHPMSQISRKLMSVGDPQSEAVARFDLPLKIIIPAFDGSASCLLGLGDLAIPSIMLSFLYRLEIPSGKRHYLVGLAGYTIGLIVAMVCSVQWHMPLPALVFLIPLSLFPALLSGLFSGELRLLFRINEDLDEEMKKLGGYTSCAEDV